jgi:cullin 4
MVQRLLEFKSFADSLVNFVFVEEPTPDVAELAPQKAATNSNSQFGYALIDAFQTGFRARRNKPAEMIAKYIDKAAREPTRDAAEADYEHRMDAVLALYRFTEDKDVFRTFYHRALAKRLLLGRSASDDDEKLLLKKLKERECSWPVV